MDVFSRFAEDVPVFDAAAATVYPEIVDQGDRREGRSADITLRRRHLRANDARLATRNGKDFAGVGVELINPWSSG